MKSTVLKRMGMASAALLLALTIGCGKPATGEVANPGTNAPVAAPAEPAKAEAPKAAAPALTGTVRYNAEAVGSSMKIEGTSTIHAWSMESGVLGGFLEADAKFPEGVASDPALAKITANVFMPVRTFKSTNKRMDEVMQEHMKEPEFKKIDYRLTELKPDASGFTATGALTIAGKTNTVTMPVAIQKVDGKLEVSGAISLKMTDYGVQPPAPKILGVPTISTGDDVKLTFKWLLAPKAP